MTNSTITTNETFDYPETNEGRLKFFNTVVIWNCEDWFTKPIQGHEDWTDEQKVDFVQNKLFDAYGEEVDYRHDETDQECLYDINHVVCFDIKNTPENFNKLTEDSSGVYAFHHAGEEDWDFLDKDIIWIEILNEWDWTILSRKAYSERMTENFCDYYGIDYSDVISKEVSVNG